VIFNCCLFVGTIKLIHTWETKLYNV
jgi:hypothetical protein